MDCTALDLSPYYLYEARSNIKEWHRLRQPKLSMGGVDGSGAHFLQAAAEKIPQPDASHDVVRATHTLYTASIKCHRHDIHIGRVFIGSGRVFTDASRSMCMAYASLNSLFAPKKTLPESISTLPVCVSCLRHFWYRLHFLAQVMLDALMIARPRGAMA